MSFLPPYLSSWEIIPTAPGTVDVRSNLSSCFTSTLHTNNLCRSPPDVIAGPKNVINYNTFYLEARKARRLALTITSHCIPNTLPMFLRYYSPEARLPKPERGACADAKPARSVWLIWWEGEGVASAEDEVHELQSMQLLFVVSKLSILWLFKIKM